MKPLKKNSAIKVIGKTRMPKPKIKIRKRRTHKNSVKKSASTTITKPNKNNAVGSVFIGQTMFIDPDTKRTRRYIVLKQRGDIVRVGKLKSIKIFDENGKNADPYLVEINQNYPGLTKRTGVDKSTFAKNLIKNQPLEITDDDVFKQEPEFRVSARDLNKAQIHTGIKKYNRS